MLLEGTMDLIIITIIIIIITIIIIIHTNKQLPVITNVNTQNSMMYTPFILHKWLDTAFSVHLVINAQKLNKQIK